jgi:DNA replication protein DnaC
MKNDDKLALLLDKLRWLRLPGMVDALEETLKLAAKRNLNVLDVVDRLADEETQSRLRRSVERRISAARFPEVNTVDGFDFSYDPCRKKLRSRYLALHDMAFLDKGINPLFLGLADSRGANERSPTAGAW